MRASRTQLFFYCLATSTRTSQGFPFRNLTNLSVLTTTFSKQAALLSSVARSTTTTTTTESSDHEMSDEDTSKSWRSLLEISIAKSRKIRGSNYVQLSTIEDGEPRCRTVVFRGFLKLPSDHTLCNDCDSLSSTLKMCTDQRSKKVSQTKEQAVAEMVWWFPKTSEQYRIRGKLILVGNESDDKPLTIARKELWGNLSDPARESFLGSLVPGEAYEKDDNTLVPIGGRDQDGKPVPPPENFLLMLMDPTNVDYLRLTGDQYRQVDARTQGEWSLQRVNP